MKAAFFPRKQLHLFSRPQNLPLFHSSLRFHSSLLQLLIKHPNLKAPRQCHSGSFAAARRAPFFPSFFSSQGPFHGVYFPWCQPGTWEKKTSLAAIRSHHYRKEFVLIIFLLQNNSGLLFFCAGLFVGLPLHMRGWPANSKPSLHFPEEEGETVAGCCHSISIITGFPLWSGISFWFSPFLWHLLYLLTFFLGSNDTNLPR